MVIVQKKFEKHKDFLPSNVRTAMRIWEAARKNVDINVHLTSVRGGVKFDSKEE